MTAGSCSSPARIIAGSPGSSCCKPKISIETTTSVGTIVARRWSANLPIVEGGRSGAELQALHPQQAVGQRAHAGELGVVGPDPVAVVQVDDRPFLQHARG